MARKHYETIDVPPDATAAEIKKAYRRKARKVHPDRGGDSDAMTELALAYRVLIDPERRAQYDATGVSKSALSISDDIRNALMEGFGAAVQQLSSPFGFGTPQVLKSVRDSLGERKTKMTSGITDTDAQIKRLKKQRERVTRRDGENWFHCIIDQAVRGMEEHVSKLEYNCKVIDGALEELKSFDERETEPTMMTTDLMRDRYLGYLGVTGG
jgi:curved DNA-binding protein CbpA